MGDRDSEFMNKLVNLFQQDEDPMRGGDMDLREIRAGEGRSLRSMHDLILFEPAGMDPEIQPQMRTLYDRFAAGPKAIRREMPLD